MDNMHFHGFASSVKLVFLGCLLAAIPLFAAQDATDYAQHFNQGGELFKQMHFRAAVEEFREATRINPQYLPAHQALILGYAVNRCFDLAWQEAALVRQAGGEPPRKLTMLLESELLEKDAAARRESNARELNAAEEEAARENANAAVLGRLSRALLQSCDFPAAQKQAYASLQLNPLEPQAQFVLATLLAGDPPTAQDAIPHWKLYLRNAPRASMAPADLAQAYESLGDAYSHQGKESEGITMYEEGLKADSENAHLLNAAAWYYATTTDTSSRNPQKALVYAQKAASVTKERNPAVLDTLGESFYANGRYDEAVTAEKKALDLNPDNDFYSDQLKKFQSAKEKSAAEKP